MVQPGFIESVFQDLNLLSDSKTKDIPANDILYPDKTVHPRQSSWNYCSVIGKFNFIVKNTWMLLIQSNRVPWISHKMHYILAMKNMHLPLHPTNDSKFDMFVNADFAGMWHREYSELCKCSLSWIGYIITYCRCPIRHWASMLLIEIALSTTESKYIALSIATQQLLPLHCLVAELHKHSLRVVTWKFSK